MTSRISETTWSGRQLQGLESAVNSLGRTLGERSSLIRWSGVLFMKKRGFMVAKWRGVWMDLEGDQLRVLSRQPVESGKPNNVPPELLFFANEPKTMFSFSSSPDRHGRYRFQVTCTEKHVSIDLAATTKEQLQECRKNLLEGKERHAAC